MIVSISNERSPHHGWSDPAVGLDTVGTEESGNGDGSRANQSIGSSVSDFNEDGLKINEESDQCGGSSNGDGHG